MHQEVGAVVCRRVARAWLAAAMSVIGHRDGPTAVVGIGTRDLAWRAALAVD